ncbi:MAG: DUF86 domain-containing protein [Ignavibacteriaceae bacterium]|nr:DUF86 domain-containing protein [Ignavibacterium sp.]MCC6254583.1 DUF86 domain-containing protein [Ignavibacteriaceae bacterium]HMN23386.1 DUF86 domain-containing protein [Ignavibacteriaceae bacterium]HRN27482.1 DUF86 domain-containing protein [Ignavibacteriaceae bacterium]HRP91405.1 DUF86 domain-containing protein [Ignavibacteriaceae bacterium]
MSKRSVKLLLQDILEALHNILSYTSDLSFDDFMNDQKTKDAVVRNFEIIGEAANKLPKNFQDQHNQIDWVGIIGFRNVLVHDYFGIDYEILWKIKSDNLTKLESEINSLLHQA